MENKFVPALVLALGVAVGGFFPGYYYYQTHADYRSVMVKGLAEKNVKADLAIWNLKIVVSGNNLQEIQQEIAKQVKKTVAFMQKQGFSDEEITEGPLETNDLMANPYRDNTAASTSRFILKQAVTVRTGNVDAVADALSQTSALIAQNIVLEEQSAAYFFTKLNEVKPQMLKEATENARQAAYEFAQNSGSKVGKIHTANQGVFSIQSRDDPNAYEPTQINKKVRVVATIDYFLED
jgi:hypothetical protein